MSNFEKINIFVPPWVKSQLDADCGMFGFLKKDGHTVNRNAFLSMVIIGYYDEFVRGANERFNSSQIHRYNRLHPLLLDNL